MITIQPNMKIQKVIYSDLHPVLDRIRTGGTLAGTITELRILPPDEYKKGKEQLPGIIFQGKFSERKNDKLQKASGLMVLDFDHCGTGFKDKLKELNWIYVLFISVGGDGVKALVKIPEVKSDEEYKQYFYAVSEELEKLYPKSLDPSGKDISRLCFFSFDPDLYINSDAIIWSKKKVADKTVQDKKYIKNDYRRAMNPLNYIRNSQEGERHTRILKASILMGGYVGAGIISEEEGIRLLKQEAWAVAPDDYESNKRAIIDGVERGKKEPLYEDLETEIKTEEKLGKIYYTESDVQDLINEKYETGLSRGYYVGWEELDKYWTLKLGATSYWYGAPYSGKTQIWYEILINTSKFYQFRHVIFSPETGAADDIFIELMQIYTGKDFYKDYHNQMTVTEKEEAQKFLDRFFIVLDPGENLITIEDFYNYVDIIERKYNTKIHTTTVDPWNELRHDLGKEARDIYLEWALGTIRQNAKSNNRHNCIITHITQQIQNKDKDSGNLYYPPASFREVAGGQSWARKGMGMISVYRPPEGLKDMNGIPYDDNETNLIVQKIKPKGSGTKGTARLYYDVKQHRYYEDRTGFIYAHEKRLPKVEEVQISWSNLPEKEDDEIPF